MTPSIELTAASAEDPRLDERLRAEPPEVRRRYLGEADRLRAGGEPQRRLAVAVYRALHADLEPGEDEDADRVLWLLEHMSHPHPAGAELARRALENGSPPDLRLRAAILAARYAESDGDVQGAARFLAAALERVRGAGVASEVDALVHAARVASDHEDCSRALALSARALARADATVALRLVADALRCRADTFAGMRDPVRCEAELQKAEHLLPRLEPADARYQRAEIAATRAASLLLRGHAAAAAGYLAPAIDAGTGRAAQERVRRVEVLRGAVLLALRRSDEAARFIARALRILGRDDATSFELGLLQVQLQRIAGGVAPARSTAIAEVERLSTVGRRVLGPSRRARLAAALARVLGERRGDLAAARRAYDLAATSLLESVSRIDRDTSDRGAPEPLDADDRAALREHRERELAAYRKLRREVARFLEKTVAREGTRFLVEIATVGPKMAACPWCERLRDGDGIWHAMERMLDSADVLEVAHAACDVCVTPLSRFVPKR